MHVTRKPSTPASTSQRDSSTGDQAAGRKLRGAEKRSGVARDLLSDAELDALELAHPDGITSAQVVDAFLRRNLKLSEATFRKYVQLGLLPRSRRVGRKGKHQGSMGLYPVIAVRRVNAIKRMMNEGYTVEDIQRSFLRWTDEIATIERGLIELLDSFERELRSTGLAAAKQRSASEQLLELRAEAKDLVGRIEHLERELSLPRERAARARAFSSGATGGAGDLL